MVTRPITDATGAIFTKAPNDSSFGKVFLNNMDKDSFSSNTKNQITSMISNGKIAMFDMHSIISRRQEYINCLVSKNLVHL